MNKKIFFLLWMTGLFATALFAQHNPCTGTQLPNCIRDQHVENGSTDWHSSQGVLSFSNFNAPTSSKGGSLSLSSTGYGIYPEYLGSSAQGAFTCYNFEKDSTYRVCFWVRNNSGCPTNQFGRLYVYAANDLIANYNPLPDDIPYARKQFIDSSYPTLVDYDHGYTQGCTGQCCAWDWRFISTTFTASKDFNNLWFYPWNPHPLSPPGVAQWGDQYIVEVDDIRVTKEKPYTLSVTATKDTISGCNDQTQLTISGMPAGAHATWVQPVTQNTTDWSVVTAKPCSTTTYKIEIADTNSCGNCIREVLYHTVYVDQWSDPANIIYPLTVVSCTDTIHLDYNDPGTCPQIGFNDYTWTEPDEITTHTGKTISILNANAYQTGEWTLSIYNSAKGCVEEHKFNITVGTCCISSPDFTFTPKSNPVMFTNTGTGITHHVSTLWNFGDGTMSDQMNPIHSYNVTTRTPFTVCLTMLYEDGQGESCCDQICKTVVVDPNTNACAVAADFNYTPVWGNEFDFSDASSGNGTICEYEWDFGGGTIIHTTLPTIRHHFPTPGPWWVCLTVTNCIYDADGIEIARCTDRKCMWVYPPSDKVAAGPGDLAQQVQSQSAEALAQTDMTSTGKHDKGLTVYPNPNSGNFTLNLYKRTGNYQVVVRDKIGRELYKRGHVFSNAPVQITLNNVSAGVYLIEVMNDNEKFVQQITITR